MSEENVIFDLSRTDYKYKGVLFAEADNEAIDKEMNALFPTPKEYIAGIVAIIWVDEKEIWHAKMRIKFPSGNKQVYCMNYDKQAKEGVNINETLVLQDLYKFPMINKIWTPNSDESGEGIIKIIKDLDMVESLRVKMKDECEKNEESFLNYNCSLCFSSLCLVTSHFKGIPKVKCPDCSNEMEYSNDQ